MRCRMTYPVSALLYAADALVIVTESPHDDDALCDAADARGARHVEMRMQSIPRTRTRAFSFMVDHPFVEVVLLKGTANLPPAVNGEWQIRTDSNTA